MGQDFQLTTRMIDADGVPQDEQARPAYPNGSSGLRPVVFENGAGYTHKIWRIMGTGPGLAEVVNLLLLVFCDFVLSWK